MMMMMMGAEPLPLHHLLLLLCAVVGSVLSATQPPLMVVYPETRVPFKPSETVQLRCLGQGSPTPTYTWKKEEEEFNPAGNDDRIVKLPNEGTLVFNRPEEKDVGMYQCFANNSFGTAMSVIFDLRLARLQPYPNLPARNMTRRPGESLKLECNEPNSYPDAEMMWVLKEKDGRFMGIDFNQRITMDHEANLIFVNVLQSDSYTDKAYVCMATNKFVRKSIYGRHYYLKTTPNQPEDHRPHLITATPNEMLFLKGETLKLKCIFGGHPTPEVRWSRNGVLIEQSTRYKFASNGLELNVHNVQFDDAGNYECYAQATNFYHKPQHVIRVKIEARPEWVDKPVSVVTSRSTATFLCNGTGIPKPRIIWYKNGKKLTTNNIPSNIKLRKTNLTVINLSAQDDMTIACNISNNYGYKVTNVFLKFFAEPPELLESKEMTMKVSEGMAINITCKTTGYDSVKVYWSKDGKQITGGRYRTMSTGSLYIKKVVVADAGIYRCEATNKYGEVSATRTLIVRRKTRIEQLPFDLEANEGTDAKFTCAGTTDPMETTKLRIIWQKDDKEIATNEERMIQNPQDNSLIISGITIRDAGRYTCLATNGLDNATASAFLTVRARPEAPSRVEVTCNTTHAAVTWTSGSTNNAPIQFYVVQANTSFDPDSWTMLVQVSPAAKRVEIQLSPWTNYTFRVLAQNKIGESKPSENSATTCRSMPNGAVPYQQPSNVHTKTDTKGKLTIMWTIMPPITHNGPDFQYLIEVKRANSTDPPDTYTISDWRVNNISITTSDVYRAYTITMKVKNSIGEANKNPVVILGYSGEDTPDLRVENPSAEISGPTTVTVKFDGVDPLSDLMKGKFNGYKVQYWKRNQKRLTFQDITFFMDSSSRLRTKRSVPGGEVELTLRNVYPYSDIEAQVLVMNTFYVGPPSDIFGFKTPEGVPGPVPYLRAAVRGSNHFLLRWDEPDDKNGYIIGYDIAYQKVNGLNLEKLRDMEPQVTDATLKQVRLAGLSSLTLYRVYIWARTSVGKGDPYFIDISTVDPRVPAKPTFSFVHIDFHYVNITWPESLKSDLHGSVYYIEYRKAESSDWQQTTDESVHSWKNVTNLESGTDYEFRVVATNGRITRASDVQEATTYGHFVGFAGTSIWLYCMLVSLLILVCIAVALYVMRERIAERRQESYRKNMRAEDEVEIFSARQVNSFYTFMSRFPKLHASTTNIGSSSEFQDDIGYSNDGGRRVRPLLADYEETGFSHEDSSIHKSRSNMSMTDGAPSPGDSGKGGGGGGGSSGKGGRRRKSEEEYGYGNGGSSSSYGGVHKPHSNVNVNDDPHNQQYLPPRYEDYTQSYDPNYDDYYDQGGYYDPNYENYQYDPDSADPNATQGYYGDDGHYYGYDDGYYNNNGDDGAGGYYDDDGAYEEYQRKRQSGLSDQPDVGAIVLKPSGGGGGGGGNNKPGGGGGEGGGGANAMTTFV